VLQHIVTERAMRLVVAVGSLVIRARVGRHLARQWAIFLLPLDATAIHHSRVCVPEQLKHPEGVAGPPVVLVAVEHDGRIFCRANPRHQLLEPFLGDVVAAELIVQI